MLLLKLTGDYDWHPQRDVSCGDQTVLNFRPKSLIYGDEKEEQNEEVVQPGVPLKLNEKRCVRF